MPYYAGISDTENSFGFALKILAAKIVSHPTHETFIHKRSALCIHSAEIFEPLLSVRLSTRIREASARASSMRRLREAGKESREGRRGRGGEERVPSPEREEIRRKMCTASKGPDHK